MNASKRIRFFVVLAIILISLKAQAQKFGYMDSEYISQRMPEYKTTITEIDKWTQRWTKEVSDKYAEIEQLERTYQNEEPLLTEPMKKERLQQIAEKEAQLKEFQNKVFGYNGLHFQKQKELMKPLIDKIGKAVEKVARQKQLMFLFDKASEGMVMIYTDPRHDYTDYILEELGISTEKETDTNKDNKQETTTPTNSKSNSKGTKTKN
jgi:outer membrane protein